MGPVQMNVQNSRWNACNINSWLAHHSTVQFSIACQLPYIAREGAKELKQNAKTDANCNICFSFCLIFVVTTGQNSDCHIMSNVKWAGPSYARPGPALSPDFYLINTTFWCKISYCYIAIKHAKYHLVPWFDWTFLLIKLDRKYKIFNQFSNELQIKTISISCIFCALNRYSEVAKYLCIFSTQNEWYFLLQLLTLFFFFNFNN